MSAVFTHPKHRFAVVAAAVIGVLAAMAAAAEAATPTPSPSPSDAVVAPLPESPGFGFGIGDLIADQINSWFAGLVTMAVKPLLDLLAVTLLATPDVSGSGRAFDLWKANAVIADAGLVLLATVGAIAAMGHETVQTRFAVKEVLPRLCVAFLAANTSFLICGKVIELANSLSTALLGQDFDGRRAMATLRFLVIVPSQQEIFYILLALVAVVLLILLLIAFVMRAALVLLLVVAAPLALACLALPYTDGLARFWARAFGGLLLIQVTQSLTLILAVRIVFNQDGRLLLGLTPTGQLVNLVLALCLLIILVRIPGWITRRIFAQTAGRGSTITRIIKYALAYKLTSPVLNALHLGRSRRGGRASGAARGAAVSAMASRALPAIAGGPAGAGAAGAATATSAARTRAGAAKSASVAARRPGQPAPAVQGKYRPSGQAPVPRNTPVYGYPRETYYANGPAGLAQMYWLRNQNSPSAPGASRPPVPPASNAAGRPNPSQAGRTPRRKPGGGGR
ncbi:conjugal transfer protein TrbL family protein [Nonomuraea harbinensis]|uniref:Conjugal transfer protein TrbL family protein n=1 Tax=Nonomuraea harbinensis TaxID=1286938 RepID=A0ABW1BLR9_9ACTN|nr:conjugal transfer protein TrbL family protein [Nonomuraea harbinensis]